MQKVFIKNRRGQKICILLQIKKRPKGLVFIMHGLGGYKTQSQMNAFARSFNRAGYSIVRFDTGNSFGQSYGKYEDATTTQYYHDLEDVMKWSKKRKWFLKPYVLVGHSLGAGCIALYASRHPSEIKAIAPTASVISGKLSLYKYSKKFLERWKQLGYYDDVSYSGKKKRLRWHHVVDRLKYNILPQASKLTMPTLMMVGTNDIRTPLKHQRLLYKKIRGPKELHIIRGSEHTFRTKTQLRTIEKIFDKWIQKIG